MFTVRAVCLTSRRRGRTYVPTAAQADGELAAEVFARLERREHPVKIVTELRANPDVAEGLQSNWARMSNRVVLEAEEMSVIRDVLRIRSVGRAPTSSEISRAL